MKINSPLLFFFSNAYPKNLTVNPVGLQSNNLRL